MSVEVEVEDRIEELLDQAARLDSGLLKVSLLEEAVALADAHQRVDLGFKVRKDLINAAYFSDVPQKALPAFSWRLAQSDRDPESFPERDLLWEYKWIIVSTAGLPQIPRPQVEELLADVTRRYQRAGFGLRAILRVRCYLAMYAGELDVLAELFSEWMRARRDAMSEDNDCERHFMVEALTYLGRYQKVLEVVRPIRQGTLQWTGIRPSTMSYALLSLMHLGHWEEALTTHRRAYPLISSNRYYIEGLSYHLRLLAATDNLVRGITLFEKHLGWAVQSTDLRLRFLFFLVSRFLLERLGRTGQTALALQLPRAFPAYQEGGHYEVSRLVGWLDGACRELADRFDARNGTNGFSRRMEEAKGWHDQVQPCSLEARS